MKKIRTKENRACFTGHREIPKEDEAKIKKHLDNVIEALYRKGVIDFAAGGAYGFDTIAEKAVLRAKERHPEIRLILILPCKDQERYWKEEQKAAFADLLSRADKVTFLEERYTRGCMHKRNRTLVDVSRYCISYLTKESGGTAYTVQYAEKKGLSVINLAGIDT